MLAEVSTWLRAHTAVMDVVDSKPLMTVLVLGFVLAGILKFYETLLRSRRRSNDPESTRPSEKAAPTREFGKWEPSPWRRPRAAPYPEWSLAETKPLPYRPFRYGPKYNVTMGLRSMEWNDWIELDSEFPKFHAAKAARIDERGAKCNRTAPDAYDAAVELLQELCEYLPERYPTLYETLGVDERTGRAAGVRNLWNNDIIEVPAPGTPAKEDPMQTAGRLVQDDLAIMIEGPDGQYYLKAGSILLAGFWRLEDKFGMPLSEIHTSGDVPQYREKLERGMMNFFRRIKPESPVLRNNYFIQVDDNLAWSDSIGPEDSVGAGESTAKSGWITAEKNKAIEHHMFRSERQSLRRLPRSGGVVFTIRTYFHPMTDVCKEPWVPGRLASAIRSWGSDVSRYKGLEKYGEILLEYLDEKHSEQVAAGLDLEKEELVRAYPY